MKNLLIIAFLATIFTGCLQETPSPEIITEPPMSRITGSDTITSGSFMGVYIQSDARNVYSEIQNLKATEGVSFLNIVGNSTSDLTQLKERIPLYSYILLDQEKGTDTGVQITLEEGKVKSIYLNSGKKLTQWPSGEKESNSIRMGDKSDVLYDKLVTIRQKSSYTSTFERISLQTKDIDTSYDTAMSKSPQWYFTHKTGKNTMNEVRIYFTKGKVDFIEVVYWEFEESY